MKLNGPLTFVPILLLVLGTSALKLEEEEPRQKRLFSLFNVVRFRNEPCSGGRLDNIGTCMSSTECVSAGGNTIGNCAAGFGICCGFSIVGCGGTVTQNCTVIRNEGFPSPTTETDKTCTYNFNRIDSNICQMRLDFQPTTTLPLATLPDGQCGVTGAELRVGSGFSNNAAAFPPVLCGQLTGQHLYFESGSTGNAGSLAISLGTTPGPRQYNIKVSYIPCDSPLRPPSGCTQYFTGLMGTVTSYNFAGGQFLGGHNYNNCIRQLEGFCSFSVAESAIVTPDPFDVSNANMIQDNCMKLSHVLIPSSVMTHDSDRMVIVIPSMRCGKNFGSVSGRDQTVPSSLPSLRNVPFAIGVRTLPASLVGGVTGLGGFSLDYTQVPC